MMPYAELPNPNPEKEVDYFQKKRKNLDQSKKQFIIDYTRVGVVF